LFASNREFCSLIAARTKGLAFDADYRKAPEHPFPAAIRDAEDSIIFHLIVNPGKYDTSNVFLGGFSAGGNIAFVIAFIIGSEHVKAVTGFYPGVYLIKQHTAPEKRISAGVIFSEILSHI
jgi:acetyl esterase/lipase